MTTDPKTIAEAESNATPGALQAARARCLALCDLLNAISALHDMRANASLLPSDVAPLKDMNLARAWLEVAGAKGNLEIEIMNIEDSANKALLLRAATAEADTSTERTCAEAWEIQEAACLARGEAIPTQTAEDVEPLLRELLGDDAFASVMAEEEANQ
jgi:hypothetical protein